MGGRLRRTALTALTAILIAAGCAPSALADSVTYQANAQHTGAVADGPAPPLGVRWALDLKAPSSYPIVAGGRVYVTVGSTTGTGYGTTLYALDAANGATIWSRPLQHTYAWSNLAYEGGTLFALDYDGVLQAFNADNGAAMWGKQLPGQYSFSSAPVADGGVVYTGGAGSGGTVYAVRESDGQVLWTAPVMNGDDSSPSLDASHVYVSYACNQAYSFDRATGALAWHHSTGCEGGGGKTTVLNGGRLYIRDGGGLVLDAASGSEVGAFASVTAPAFSGDVSLFVSGGTLAAERTSSRTPLWSFTADQSLSSAPFVAGATVYEGSSTGAFYAFDRDSGALLWSDCLPGPVAPPDEQNVSQPLTGLGAGGGLLVVPAGNWLVAYESRPGAPSYVCTGSGPAPAASGTTAPGTTGAPAAGAQGSPAITLSASRHDLHFGQVVTLRGTAPAGSQVQLLSDAFPVDKFSPRKSTTAAADGTFSFRVRPDRNTSFKAVAGTAESAATIVYTDAASRLRGRAAAGGRWRLTSIVAGPRDLPYRARRITFYAITKSGRTARRIGSARLRGGSGSFKTSVVTRVRVKHYAACMRERTPDAWGRPLPIDETCGARRLKLP